MSARGPDGPAAGSARSRPLAVFDIDGVVADVRHRLHHLTGRHNWHAFFREAGGDPLLAEGAALAHDLAERHDIAWLTGRPEWLRKVTADWLDRHDLPPGALWLRPDGDYRPARHYKLGVLRRLRDRDGRTVAAVVDDDVEVVDAALAHGFPAVLADWVPRDGAAPGTGRDTGRTVGDVLAEAQERLGRT